MATALHLIFLDRDSPVDVIVLIDLDIRSKNTFRREKDKSEDFFLAMAGKKKMVWRGVFVRVRAKLLILSQVRRELRSYATNRTIDLVISNQRLAAAMQAVQDKIDGCATSTSLSKS